MRPLRVRRAMKQVRVRLGAMLVIGALGGAIAAHHSGVLLADAHHDGLQPAVELCLGVLVAVGTAVVAAVAILGGRRRFATVGSLAAVPSRAAESWAPSARAGPLLLSRLCVWRR